MRCRARCRGNIRILPFSVIALCFTTQITQYWAHLHLLLEICRPLCTSIMPCPRDLTWLWLSHPYLYLHFRMTPPYVIIVCYDKPQKFRLDSVIRPVRPSSIAGYFWFNGNGRTKDQIPSKRGAWVWLVGRIATHGGDWKEGWLYLFNLLTPLHQLLTRYLERLLSENLPDQVKVGSVWTPAQICIQLTLMHWHRSFRQPILSAAAVSFHLLSVQTWSKCTTEYPQRGFVFPATHDIYILNMSS